MTTIEQALAAFAALEQPRGPTVRELQEELGLASTSQTARWLQKLMGAGLIEEIPPTTITGISSRAWRLSTHGHIAAGRLAEAG